MSQPAGKRCILRKHGRNVMVRILYSAGTNTL